MKKYYLELLSPLFEGQCNDYLAQTSWVDSIDEAIKQYKKIKRFIRTMFDYEDLTSDIFMFHFVIMCSEWNTEEDCCTDIDQYGKIYENEKGKVVIERYGYED